MNKFHSHLMQSRLVAPSHTKRFFSLTQKCFCVFLFLTFICSHQIFAATEKDEFVRLSYAASNIDEIDYQITLLKSGDVKFEGKKGTKVIGVVTEKISSREFSKIVEKLNQADFFNMKDRYPSFGKIEWKENGKKNRIS